MDVAVTLSTAQPGRAIALPRLLTWTLGEQRDFLPQPQAVADVSDPGRPPRRARRRRIRAPRRWSWRCGAAWPR
ncbi:MAG: hypothetical protein R3F43_30480 [bacterium]